MVRTRSLLTVTGACAVLLVAATALAVDAPDCGPIELEFREFSLGANGAGHLQRFPENARLPLAVAKQCSNDAATCQTDLDCGGGATCDLSCSCDDECQVLPALDSLRCLGSLERCSTNADCPDTETCEALLGPPLPESYNGIPGCITHYLDSALTGTVDLGTGAATMSFATRWRAHLGVAVERPCPSCGTPEQAPVVGEIYTCFGGPNEGQACKVDAVSDEFGGVSFNCPPDPESNLSGPGIRMNFAELSTGTVSEQATLPCAPPLDDAHPSSGNAVCLDGFLSCSSNADCMRCTDDLSVCNQNSDCSTGVTCATSPDQPVSCGVYCHCGYCDDDPERSCFGDFDCDPGQECVAGSGTSPPSEAVPQASGNDCNNFMCGEQAAGTCCQGESCIRFGTSPFGECSLAPYRACKTNAHCAEFDAGECEYRPQPCFENRIETVGRAGSEPELAGISCAVPLTSGVVNAALGLPGPVTLRVLAHFDELSPPPDSCGKPITTGELPTVTDCLFILQTAVQLNTCTPQCLCDVDSSNSVTVADALRCLQVATQVPGAGLDCPCPD